MLPACVPDEPDRPRPAAMRLVIHPPLELQVTDDHRADVEENVRRFGRVNEQYVRDYPHNYGLPPLVISERPTRSRPARAGHGHRGRSDSASASGTAKYPESCSYRIACTAMDLPRRSGERVRPPDVASPARQGLRFPDFLCIGAQKAGTTWLYMGLVGHPDVWLPPVKELHYFDQLYVHTLGEQERDDELWRQRGQRTLARDARLQPPRADGSVEAVASLVATATVSDEWYGSIFALAPSGSICGELTPSYALLPDDGIRHLVALNPDVKILFLARDPIDRAVAQMRMLFKPRDRGPRMSVSPLRVLDVEPGILKRSRYSETLRRYRQHVDERAIWIGDFDRLADDPEALLRSVCAFLGVEFDGRLFPEMHQKVNVGVRRDFGDAAYKRLRDALEPEYDELAQIIPEAASRWKTRHYG